MKISASVLSADFARLACEIQKVEAGGADWIHWDVMDGCFVPNLTFGSPLLQKLRSSTSLPFDAHLMVAKPEKYVARFKQAGADYFTFHIEASEHPQSLIQKVKDAGMKAGVALNPSSPLPLIDSFLPNLDLVLVMSVQPGFAGQAFLPSVLDKLKQLAEQKAESNLSCLLAVDGGIKKDQAKLCREAGADIIVAASYIFQGENYTQRITDLRG